MSKIREAFEKLRIQAVPGNLVPELALLDAAVSYLEKDPKWAAIEQSLSFPKPIRISEARAAKTGRKW